MSHCDLCELKPLTKRYFEDDLIVICDCLTCQVPMVVLRRHTMSPTKEELERIEEKVKEIFGEEKFKGFRKKQRNIFDHMHYHILLN